MAPVKVLILGATGETGSSILNGLVEHAGFEPVVFIREASLENEATKTLKSQGVKVISAPANATSADLVPVLTGIDVVVSAISPTAQLDQLKWIDAAKEAGVKRFIPCGFTTICPRGDIMRIRDEKEMIHDHIFRLRLPYTIIDVGFWYVISTFPVPSGKLDYAIQFPSTEIFGDGTAPNMLVDKDDIGRYVARIISDPRTLNKRVAAYGDQLSQNEIGAITEQVSGEKISFTHVTNEEAIQRRHDAIAACGDSTDFAKFIPVVMHQYNVSKYIRGDNAIENAEYLGYLNARVLYPDFVPKSFEQYIKEAFEGKAVRPYPHLNF